jgi:hypothetical protein
MYYQVLPGIAKAHKKHLDDLVPNSNFLILHCLGVVSSASGIRLYHIEKYVSKL